MFYAYAVRFNVITGPRYPTQLQVYIYRGFGASLSLYVILLTIFVIQILRKASQGLSTRKVNHEFDATICTSKVNLNGISL